ncbi:MAG: ArsA family ATPase [Acidobacteriota bacterium]
MESDSPSRSSPRKRRFDQLSRELTDSFDSIADRRLILFGGKGGVGKTTLAALAALHYARTNPTIIFSTDPASNLNDLFGDEHPEQLRIEQLDADKLYREYLRSNLPSFLELGDRGTYLDREELQRLFELAVPGIDELMSWIRIGDLVGEGEQASITIIDTAPTGHTLRMLSSGRQFRAFGQAIEAMQEKHRELVAQLTRREVRDAMDEFLDRFNQDGRNRAALLTDPERTAFVPVLLAEPWVVAQTQRLIHELRAAGIDTPFAILNHAVHDCDCHHCLQRNHAEAGARKDLQPIPIIASPRSCSPLDSTVRLKAFLNGHQALSSPPGIDPLPSANSLSIAGKTRLIFFAGKGGVGKTSSASSVALQYAAENLGSRFTLLSIDPAHSLTDVFFAVPAPANLQVETIDTKARWNELRESLGDDIGRAMEELTPRGISLSADQDVARRLIELAPPGADELFAVMRLHELLAEDVQTIFVDTAPTGHFLRFLDLPAAAGQWVREFMRILLRYRNLIPAGRLGEQLLNASRALRSFETTIRSDETAVVVVTRPERIVVAETIRLLNSLRDRPLAIAGVVVNHITGASQCLCDQQRRNNEWLEIGRLANEKLVLIEEQPANPVSGDDLLKLVPLLQTAAS